MKIINKTKNTVLAEDAVIADKLGTRIKGLLGRKVFLAKEGLVITPCNSIHTFFMHFAIDVLFVNKANMIVKTISSLSPGRLTSIYFNAAFVIELPTGAIQSTSTSQGDFISIE
ncbi:MAG: hypothetical protein A3K83_07305 [Omnitrophica WOR_2 bacterium RBG_13_44_8b]|nr:MAG: hypothetical protein A3K83_07305 [Omnitrophica WOR_2 bacterium RBG_13_44_8b]